MWATFSLARKRYPEWLNCRSTGSSFSTARWSWKWKTRQWSPNGSSIHCSLRNVLMTKTYVDVPHEVGRGHWEADVLRQRKLLPYAPSWQHGGVLRVLRRIAQRTRDRSQDHTERVGSKKGLRVGQTKLPLKPKKLSWNWRYLISNVQCKTSCTVELVKNWS